MILQDLGRAGGVRVARGDPHDVLDQVGDGRVLLAAGVAAVGLVDDDIGRVLAERLDRAAVEQGRVRGQVRRLGAAPKHYDRHRGCRGGRQHWHANRPQRGPKARPDRGVAVGLGLQSGITLDGAIDLVPDLLEAGSRNRLSLGVECGAKHSAQHPKLGVLARRPRGRGGPFARASEFRLRGREQIQPAALQLDCLRDGTAAAPACLS